MQDISQFTYRRVSRPCDSSARQVARTSRRVIRETPIGARPRKCNIVIRPRRDAMCAESLCCLNGHYYRHNRSSCRMHSYRTRSYVDFTSHEIARASFNSAEAFLAGSGRVPKRVVASYSLSRVSISQRSSHLRPSHLRPKIRRARPRSFQFRRERLLYRVNWGKTRFPPPLKTIFIRFWFLTGRS